MTRRASFICALVVLLSLMRQIAEAATPTHPSHLLQDIGSDNSTDIGDRPPHKHHNNSNFIYTASLMLVAVPTVVGLSAAAVLVKRSMTQFQNNTKGPTMADMEEESKVGHEDADDEEAKKSSAEFSNAASAAEKQSDKTKGKSSFWVPAMSRGGTYARPKSFYVNIQREDSENFFELTLATPMEDNEDTPRGQQKDDKSHEVYNLRI